MEQTTDKNEEQAIKNEEAAIRRCKDTESFELAQKLLTLVEGDRITQEDLFDKVQPTVVELLLVLAKGTHREKILLKKFPFWFDEKEA